MAPTKKRADASPASSWTLSTKETRGENADAEVPEESIVQAMRAKASSSNTSVMSQEVDARSESGSMSLGSGEDEDLCSDSDCSENFRVELSDFEPTLGWNDNAHSCKCSCVGRTSSLTAVCSRDTLADDLSIPSHQQSQLECRQSDRRVTVSRCRGTRILVRSRSSSVCTERERMESTEYRDGVHRDLSLPARSAYEDSDDEATSPYSETVEPRSRLYVRAVRKGRSLCKATQVTDRMMQSQTNALCMGHKTSSRGACFADIATVAGCLGEREKGEDGRVVSSCLVSTTRTGETANKDGERECAMDICPAITPSSRVQHSGETAARESTGETAGVDDEDLKSTSQESCSCSCGAEQRRYQPIANSTRRRLATQLNLRISRLEHLGAPGPLKRPRRLHNPLEDGNCFFRAISFALTGREAHHRALRHKVVCFMRHSISQQLESYLSLPVQDYVEDSKMAAAGVWATDVEVMATAALLGVDIVVFRYCGGRRQWLTYPASFDLQRQSRESIYLQNSGGHFYLVTAT